jgi:hypothetical protein
MGAFNPVNSIFFVLPNSQHKRNRCPVYPNRVESLNSPIFTAQRDASAVWKANRLHAVVGWVLMIEDACAAYLTGAIHE